MATTESEVPGTAVAVAAPNRMVGLLKPIAPVADIIASQEQTREFIAKALKKGRDYGVIPGTDRGDGGGKNVMYLAGAQRTCAAFGVRPEFEIVSSEVDHDREVVWRKRQKKWGQRRGEFTWAETNGVSNGLYRYVIRCTLLLVENGVSVGSGVGSCSTVEAKYVDRPRESENTVLKMAKKRAYVDATLATFGLSDAFTQDLEEGFEEADAEVVASEPLATPEQVRAYRASIVELGATPKYLKWFDEQTKEPMPVGWFEAAVADVRKKAEEKRQREVETRTEPAPEQPEVFARREEPAASAEPPLDEDSDDLPF